MNAIHISVTDNDSARRYVARIQNYVEEGELELSRLSPTMVIAAHTG
jgi:hypothetical protein